MRSTGVWVSLPLPTSATQRRPLKLHPPVQNRKRRGRRQGKPAGRMFFERMSSNAQPPVRTGTRRSTTSRPATSPRTSSAWTSSSTETPSTPSAGTLSLPSILPLLSSPASPAARTSTKQLTDDGQTPLRCSLRPQPGAQGQGAAPRARPRGEAQGAHRAADVRGTTPPRRRTAPAPYAARAECWRVKGGSDSLASSPAAGGGGAQVAIQASVGGKARLLPASAPRRSANAASPRPPGGPCLPVSTRSGPPRPRLAALRQSIAGDCEGDPLGDAEERPGKVLRGALFTPQTTPRPARRKLLRRANEVVLPFFLVPHERTCRPGRVASCPHRAT